MDAVRDKTHAIGTFPIAVAAFVLAGQFGVAADDKPGSPPTAAAKEERSYPSIPRSLRAAPEWLKGDVPFDLARYFAAVPENDNGAGLYLDAFYEFDPGAIKDCVSPAERERRTQALLTRWYDENDQSTASERAKMLGEYAEAFRKLALAQTKPRCVFETGIDLGDSSGAPIPAPRRVAQLIDWRVDMHLASGNIADALADVEMALRMGRDLRPRGAIIRQLVSMAIDLQILNHMVPRILGAAGLTVVHCDRILELISRHRREGLDPLAEGFRGEYLVIRHLLHRMEVDEKYRAGLELTDELAAFTAADYAAEVAALNRYFRPLIDFGDRPRKELDQLLPDQKRALKEMKIAFLGTFLPVPDPEPNLNGSDEPVIPITVVDAFRRQQTRASAARCLVAVRRWQLEHGRALPPDLITCCKAAGMPSVPADEYSTTGESMRFLVRDVEFLIYSVAVDRRDDRAQVEWNFERDGAKARGDWVFRLPPLPGAAKR
jgi:hypothetical protein